MTSKDVTEMQRADAAGISRAEEILRSGGLVAVPTETVYGLAARADDAEAVARIYRAKGRPSRNPLIVHVPSIDAAQRLADFSAKAMEIARWGWPGPLTLVLPRARNSGLADAVSAGLPTVAIRIPAAPAMQALLRAVNLPLAAPSANRSNGVSPTTAEHVAASLGSAVDMILDGGPCEKGLESTILAIRHDGAVNLLRPGPTDISRWAQRPRESADDAIEAPGQMRSHYSPGKPVRLNAKAAQDEEFLIGFGKVDGDCNLSATGNLEDAAHALYDALHAAAASPHSRVAVAPIPQTGIGLAINDRLRRAAAPGE